MTPEINTVDDLLDWWPGNIPFKGSLISDDNCMCAQGQALHFLGGMSPDDLRRIEQAEADNLVAKIMGISRAHSVLLRNVNDTQPGAPTCVIREPEKILGPEARRVLAFWRHLDRMKPAQWEAAQAAAWAAAGAVAWDAARAAAGDAAQAAAWAAAGAAAWDAAWASNEIQGASVMRGKGRPFFFLPLFGIATPEELDAIA